MAGLLLPDILDIEASGFGPDSYPIEIGFALASGERFCTLIRPHHSWYHWCPHAQQVHGISRATLDAAGMALADVCQELNTRLSGARLYSDAWVCDSTWLDRLFHCAEIAPSFRLHAIEHIQSECQYTLWDKVYAAMSAQRTSSRHRASSDACFIQQVFDRTRALCASTEP